MSEVIPSPGADPHFFTPRFVRRFVVHERPGAYLLGALSGSDFTVGYVGRSDRCVRDRLLRHELLGEFDVFAVRYARTANEAFSLECAFWHTLADRGHALQNVLHPAVPRNSRVTCPYCRFANGMVDLFAAA